MLPARATELARTADLHILYRRAASAYAGAITPEVKAQLWAQAEKQVPPLKEKEIMTDIEDIRADHEYHQEHPTPTPTPVDVDALVEAHEPTPAPEAPVFDDASQTEAEKIAAALAHDNMGMAAELGKAKERIAALESANEELSRTCTELVLEKVILKQDRDELKARLADLHASQQMTPLARTGGAVEVCYFCEVVNTTGNQTDAAHKLGALRSENWSIVYEQFIIDNGWTKHHVARLERQLRAAEPKPDADKPTNVRDFPVPDADLTTEDDDKGALACVPAAKGMGNGGVARRVS